MKANLISMVQMVGNLCGVNQIKNLTIKIQKLLLWFGNGVDNLHFINGKMGVANNFDFYQDNNLKQTS